jgi:hypothetical protein
MNTLGTIHIPNRLDNPAWITAVICLLLAVSFSLTSGIPYGTSLAQATLFYQYITLHLSTLISR